MATDSTGHSVRRSESWILLVEDDPLFARLFQRFWKRSCPGVPCRLVVSLKELAETFALGPFPDLVICDRRLPDGMSEDFPFPDGLERLIWSADSGGDVLQKPIGRAELEASVERISLMLGREDV